MNINKPLVSIGIPVFNEEKYIGQTLDSLLTQDYGNFELIISDNASEDATQEICLQYMKRDNRIRYYRNDLNIGALKNFQQVFKLSKGEYFMWASGHDLWAQSFISRCVEILQQDPNIVLCYSQIIYIGPNGKELPLSGKFLFDTRISWGKRSRFFKFLWGYPTPAIIYGVIRASALEKAISLSKSLHDIVLLAQLSLLGTFAQIPEPLFYYRLNRGQESLEGRLERYPYTLFPPTNKKRFVFPHWHMMYELSLIPLRERVGWLKKFFFLWCTISACLARWGPSMVREIKWYVREIVPSCLIHRTKSTM